MAGRGKKKEITAAQMKQAERYARKGHQNGTICELMEWDHNLIEQRPDIKKRLTKMRAWHKDDIRNDQERIRKTDGKGISAAATMAIFQGKNELGQADKQETVLSGAVEHVVLNFTDVKLAQISGDSQTPKLSGVTNVDGPG